MAFSGDEITHIPMLKSAMGIRAGQFVIDIELNLSATILNRGKTGFSHHALENHAASYFDMNLLGGQFFFS